VIEPTRYLTLDSLYRDCQTMTPYKRALVESWHELGEAGREEEYQKALREYDLSVAMLEVESFLTDESDSAFKARLGLDASCEPRLGANDGH